MHHELGPAHHLFKCDAMRCDVMRRDAMRCDAMQCDLVPWVLWAYVWIENAWCMV
jgi:hypothetical protein